MTFFTVLILLYDIPNYGEMESRIVLKSMQECSRILEDMHEIAVTLDPNAIAMCKESDIPSWIDRPRPRPEDIQE